MQSTSEKGHAKNVANFGELISFCSGYGTTYNPSRDALTVTKLSELQSQAHDSLLQVIASKTSFANATNVRKLAFKDLKSLSTRIVNALSASGASVLTVANAKTINRKIQGTKALSSPKTVTINDEENNEIPTIKSISTSQQSHDSMIEHFTKLIENITQETNYNPNETDLKVATLQAKLDSLKTSNADLLNANMHLSNARINRNEVLYHPEHGMVKSALEVKKYLKSVYGATSPQFRQVSSLQFIKVRDR